MKNHFRNVCLEKYFIDVRSHVLVVMEKTQRHILHTKRENKRYELNKAKCKKIRNINNNGGGGSGGSGGSEDGGGGGGCSDGGKATRSNASVKSQIMCVVYHTLFANTSIHIV